MWEHEGSSVGGQYQWYVYFRGEGIHTYADALVYFSPRLRVEQTNFPTYLVPGSNVVVPVEWESLPASNVPARLRLRLVEAFSGTIYFEATSAVTVTTGSTNMTVLVPTAPASSNYLWSTFLYATNATNAWLQRFGSDDTYRFNDVGIGLEPETRVTMEAVVPTSGTYGVYSDAGTPAGSSIFTWNGSTASFDGNYADATAPEGALSFYTFGTFWQGWGVFKSGTDMSLYSNGYLKFWVKSPVTVKVDLESPAAKLTVYVSSTTNNWLLKSIAITNFNGIVLTNMYGLFEATTESSSTFFIDDVKWSIAP
jgi:hypothetical protein